MVEAAAFQGLAVANASSGPESQSAVVTPTEHTSGMKLTALNPISATLNPKSNRLHPKL